MEKETKNQNQGQRRIKSDRLLWIAAGYVVESQRWQRRILHRELWMTSFLLNQRRDEKTVGKQRQNRENCVMWWTKGVNKMRKSNEEKFQGKAAVFWIIQSQQLQCRILHWELLRDVFPSRDSGETAKRTRGESQKGQKRARQRDITSRFKKKSVHCLAQSKWGEADDQCLHWTTGMPNNQKPDNKTKTNKKPCRQKSGLHSLI